MRQLTTAELNRIKECNSCFVVGVLAHEYFYPGVGEEDKPVTVIRNGSDVVFYVRAISPEPAPIEQLLNDNYREDGKTDLYIGIDRFQNESFFGHDYSRAVATIDRVECVEKSLDNKVFLFNPYFNLKSTTKDAVYKNLRLVSVEKEFDGDRTPQYQPVVRVHNFNHMLEEQMINERFITIPEYCGFMPQIKFMLCGDYLYFDFDTWEVDPKNNVRWMHAGMKKIKKIKVDVDSDEFKNNKICANDNLIFLDDAFLQKLISEEQCVDICEKDDSGDASHEQIVPETSARQVAACVETLPSRMIHESMESEMDFLLNLKNFTIRQRLCYDFNDLVNFHTSVKTNPLTIIAGMSGMGKSQLALAYAEMLGLAEGEEKTLLIIPISPSYTEPGDLLGYMNNNSGYYVPSETGLTDFLVQAGGNQDKMYMVVFEEMNLSQVEHWFAPFISLLELNSEQRRLHLYSEESHCRNSDKYPHTVTIGDNVMFIGTVNMDETTKDFSDRLLDRANIVVPRKKSFMELKKEQGDSHKLSYCRMENDSMEYMSWINNSNPLSAYSDGELQFLDELHDLIQKYDEQKGVSFRAFERMGNYLNNLPCDSQGKTLISKEDALDIQIKQRLLTKIKGTSEQFEGLIGLMKNTSKEPVNSELYEFFNSDAASTISHFTLTKKEIMRKARELCLYGYAN